MSVETGKADIFKKLQQEILPLQGYKTLGGTSIDIQCHPLASAFPGNQFPTGAVHEMITRSQSASAASAGFIAAISSVLMKKGGVALWINSSPIIFPPALIHFGIDPARVIFIHPGKEKDVLWTTEEALKCNGLAVVVSELKDLNFTHSRRLQLAVEQSGVTGFVMHHHKKQLGSNACIARWQITPLRSQLPNDIPGVGYPRWKVELLKVRNGKPGNWIIEWKNFRLREVNEQSFTARLVHRKTG